jgi:magnesium chelatase family protein
MAVGILADMGQIDPERLEEFMIMGELSLDGSVNRICGVLPAVCEAKTAGIHRCIVPAANYREARMVDGMSIYGVTSLADAVYALNHDVKPSEEIMSDYVRKSEGKETGDFADIAGQYAAKRAAMIAAAGRHNLLYMGPPGSGKSMLASRIPGILPPLSRSEALEIAKIYSVAGLLEAADTGFIRRPFRNPHYSVTRTGFIGGGQYPRPGEVTLAHQGVLFLDELPLFHPEVLESLRNPLEEKQVQMIRGGQTILFPADFMLVAAMNPCRCGYYPDRNRCSCTEVEIARYMGRISKPLLDRFDMTLRVDRPSYDELAHKREKTGRMVMNTEYMKERVLGAVRIQRKRYAHQNISYNSQLSTAGILKYCKIDESCGNFLKKLYDNCTMSARGYHRLLKVARTIADLDGSYDIEAVHISEAVAYRCVETGGGEKNG